MTLPADPTPADRAVAILSSTPHIAIPLTDLARSLDASAAALAVQLSDDARFVVIRPTAFPDLSLLPESDRAAYDAALRAAGVHSAPSIALRSHASGGRHDSVPLLLRDSVARLLASTPQEDVLAAAERTRVALTCALGPFPDRDGTVPSTTPPPDPPERTRPRPPRRRSPRRPPRYPGSHRG